MSIPFGFQPPSGEGDPMNQIGKALEQLGKMMSAGSDGSVNWLAVSDIAKQAIDAQGDVLPTMHESSSTQTAGRTVDLWLDQVMGLPSIGLDLESWSRKNFVDNTIDSWKLLSDPVLRRMTDSMTSMMPGSEALPQEVAAMAAPMMNMLKGISGAMVGMQVGQSLAALASDVMGASDIGILLTKKPRAALLVQRCTSYANEISVEQEQTLLHLAAREVARQRLFSSIDWLSGAITTSVEIHAAGMQVDTQRLQQALQEVDPTNPEALARALEGGVLNPILTPEQQAALIRLENLLALIEGWTEMVVKAATESKLAAYPALAESMRRRRATGGPAENAFAALVGLEIRPKRMRAAFEFWQTLTNLVGHQKRELVWNNLELMPQNDDLDNPVEFAQQVARQL